MSFKVGDKIRFSYSMLFPHLKDLKGIITTKMRSCTNGETEYYVKVEGLKTFHFSEWFLINYSKPIKFYHYGI